MQLGMMVIAIGLSSYNVALFHLVNHAFYKGLLFLGAGAVIHAVADNQDFRKYGGLISFLPLTYSVILIASLSLVAFPFMTGFYSKDFILESAFGQFSFSSIAVYVIATIGAIFTTLYSVKVLYLTFLANPNGSSQYYKHAHEGDIFLSLPLVILAIFSIFFGYITKDLFIGLGSSFFIDNSIYIHPNHEIFIVTEFAVPTIFKLLPLIFTISFSVLAILFSEFLPKSLINFKLSRLGYNIFGFFNQRFLIEMFYNRYITNFILNLGGQTTRVLDKGSIELIGPFGLEIGLLKLSKNISCLSTGVVTSYALYILAAFILYVSISYFLFTNSQDEVWVLFFIILFSVTSLFIYSNSPALSKKTSDVNSKKKVQLSSSVFMCLNIQSIYIWSIKNLKNIFLFFYGIFILYVIFKLYINIFVLFNLISQTTLSPFELLEYIQNKGSDEYTYHYNVIGVVSETSPLQTMETNKNKFPNILCMNDGNNPGQSDNHDRNEYLRIRGEAAAARAQSNLAKDMLDKAKTELSNLNAKDSLTEDELKKKLFWEKRVSILKERYTAGLRNRGEAVTQMKEGNFDSTQLHAGYKENENFIPKVEEPEYTNKNTDGNKRVTGTEEQTSNKK